VRNDTRRDTADGAEVVSSVDAGVESVDPAEAPEAIRLLGRPLLHAFGAQLARHISMRSLGP
jgi:hypothetical protein